MAVLRFLSALFFLIALVALAADATPLLSGSVNFHAASVQSRWSEIAPAVLSSAERSLAGQGLGWLWSWIVAPIIALPAFMVFSALALLFGYVGRRRRRINVFIN